jgi:hypothetical protein
MQRFISEAPIRLWGGINFYSMTGNNPVNFIDPFGLDWVSSVLGTASYVTNTAGIFYKPAKIAGIGISVTAGVYSYVQYKRGKMSCKEAGTNIGLALGDIGFGSIEKILPVTSIVGGFTSRALGNVNTVFDIVNTLSE